MAAAGHFVKNLKKKKKIRLDLKWPKMPSKVNFGHPIWPTADILSKISNKNKVAYRSEMARNAIESEFRRPFCKQFPNKTRQQANTPIFVLYILDRDSHCPYLLSGETTFQLTSC